MITKGSDGDEYEGEGNEKRGRLSKEVVVMNMREREN